MAETKEDAVVVEMTKAIRAIETPTFRVRQELCEKLDGASVQENDVFITATGYENPEAIGTSRREHSEFLIAARTKIVAPSETTSAYAEVFKVAKALRGALKDWPALQGGGGAGIEQIRRRSIEPWFMPMGDTGQPAGVIMIMMADWSE